MTNSLFSNAKQTNWSIGETAALAVKAARGAGMPWGLADEVGFTVSWLQERGLPDLSALSRYLQWHESELFVVWPEIPPTNYAYCPIKLGCAYIDGVTSQFIRFGSIREPLLMIPFIAKRNLSLAVDIKLDELSISLINNQLISDQLNSEFLLTEANCVITRSTTIIESTTAEEYSDRVPHTFVECIRTLNEFAQKTYAPATEESRLTGAGAGLNDND